MNALTIRYCPRCRWLPRACWLAQELLATFDQGLSVTLIPAESGVFRVSLDEEVIFDRKDEGRFPEPKEIKQRVRDRIDPGRDLGHSDG